MQKLNMETLISRAIERDAEDEPRRHYLGASGIGGPCERELWYYFRWYLESKFPGRVHRRFETGNAYEQRVVRRLRQAGAEVTDTNPRARNPRGQYAAEAFGGFVRGHVDGFITIPPEMWSQLMPGELTPKEVDRLSSRAGLLEIKALGSAKYEYAADDHGYDHPLANKRDSKGRKIEGRWFELARRGVEDAQRKHFAQIQMYMGLSNYPDRKGKVHHEKWGLGEPLRWAVYIGVNTDTDQWHAELVDYDQAWFAAGMRRAERVVRATTPPDRVANNPDSWHCGFCDYKEICHMQGEEDRNCRSCAHSSIKVPGDRGYFGKTGVWVCNLHRQGCGDFEACHDWGHIQEVETMPEGGF